jgi:DNA polymerase-3 subunit epsilon
MKYTIKEVRAILGEPDGAQRGGDLEMRIEGNKKPMLKVKIRRSGEKLKGGKGDNKPDSAFDPKQLSIGIGDETGEHTPDKEIGKEIAKDHLSQDPDYYKKLKAAGIDEAQLAPFFKKYHNNLLKRGWDTSDAEEIGSGYNGTAYKFGGNKVLKVTTDESEIKAATFIRGRSDLKHVIHVYDTFSFAKENDYEHWYGIVADLADPLPNENVFGDYIFFISNKVNLQGEHIDNPWNMDWNMLKQRVMQNCFDDKEDILFAKEAFNYFHKLGFPQLFDELKRNKIEYKDVHSDNFKTKNGKIVLVDLGGNTKSPGKVPPQLKEKQLNESPEEIRAWKNSRWMFIDTETTGLPPDKRNPNRKDPRAVQVGYAIVDNMKVVEVFNSLVDPGEDVEIDPTAAAVTGIDREKLKASNAQGFSSIMEKIKKDIESCDIIMSYNIRFDKPVMEREFKLAGIEIPKKHWLDPMIWLMKNLPLPNHKLSTVTNHYKVSLEHAHDAGADAEAAAKVTMAFVQTFDGLPDSPADMVKLQGKWSGELRAARIAAWKAKQNVKEETEDKEQQKNFYVLVGPPAVGKSTWIKKNFVDTGKNFEVVSYDEIIDKIIYPKYGLTAKDVWSKVDNKSPEAVEAFKEVQRLFADKIKEVAAKRPDNIIVDGLNATKKSRAQSLRIANLLPKYKKIAVKFEFAGYEDKILQADIARAKERGGQRVAINPEVIKSKMAAITANPPTTAEGFDEVISYNRFIEPLKETKLSAYWRKRAARRAKNASRKWPNAIDRNWALAQQEKSKSIDSSIQNIFQKELDETEETLDDVSRMMSKVKKIRDEMRIRREAKQSFDHPAKATQRRKNGKSLSVRTRPERGVKKGFDKKRKALKGPVLAPGESFGPSEE